MFNCRRKLRIRNTLPALLFREEFRMNKELVLDGRRRATTGGGGRAMGDCQCQEQRTNKEGRHSVQRQWLAGGNHRDRGTVREEKGWIRERIRGGGYIVNTYCTAQLPNCETNYGRRTEPTTRAGT